MTITLPSSLVETAWLQAHLAVSDLRILDCTVLWHEDPDGPWFENGRTVWAEGHIPGSSHVDLAGELCDQSTDIPFMLPPAGQFAAAMSRHGVGDDSVVVLTDSVMNIWAARTWWMLRALGFDNAAVLNGGRLKWQAEGRPLSTAAVKRAAGQFTPQPRPGLFVSKAEVLAALGRDDVLLINALGRESYRQSRIPGSQNVTALEMTDPIAHAYLPLSTLRQRFEQVRAFAYPQIITYCRAGITACSDAFILHLLGVEHLSVYDGSLWEWTADPALPLETG